MPAAPTESSDATLQDTGPNPSSEGKEMADIDGGHNPDGDGDKQDGERTATGASGVRDSSKRAADTAGLNEGGDGIPRSEKVRRTGQSARLLAVGRV